MLTAFLDLLKPADDLRQIGVPELFLKLNGGRILRIAQGFDAFAGVVRGQFQAGRLVERVPPFLEAIEEECLHHSLVGLGASP